MCIRDRVTPPHLMREHKGRYEGFCSLGDGDRLQFSSYPFPAQAVMFYQYLFCVSIINLSLHLFPSILTRKYVLISLKTPMCLKNPCLWYCSRQNYGRISNNFNTHPFSGIPFIIYRKLSRISWIFDHQRKFYLRTFGAWQLNGVWHITRVMTRCHHQP